MRKVTHNNDGNRLCVKGNSAEAVFLFADGFLLGRYLKDIGLSYFKCGELSLAIFAFISNIKSVIPFLEVHGLFIIILFGRCFK